MPRGLYVHYDKFIELYMKELSKRGIMISDGGARDTISAFTEALKESFTEHPTVEVGTLGTFDLTTLQPRIRVLRGVSYPSHQRYKVRFYPTEDVYSHLESTYDKYQEDLE